MKQDVDDLEIKIYISAAWLYYIYTGHQENKHQEWQNRKSKRLKTEI